MERCPECQGREEIAIPARRNAALSPMQETLNVKIPKNVKEAAKSGTHRKKAKQAGMVKRQPVILL